MWNSRTYAAMAIAGAGLALAAVPASAQWLGYGSAGCGGYGAAYGAGYGAGTFTYGWPYATNVGGYGFGGGAFGYAPGYGWGIGNSPAFGYGYGFAPAFGYGYSYAPAYGYGGYGGWGCGRGHRVRGYGYATVSRRSYGYAVASHRTHHDVAMKPVRSHIASRNNLTLARAD
jgi:hypothetical protein